MARTGSICHQHGTPLSLLYFDLLDVFFRVVRVLPLGCTRTIGAVRHDRRNVCGFAGLNILNHVIEIYALCFVLVEILGATAERLLTFFGLGAVRQLNKGAFHLEIMYKERCHMKLCWAGQDDTQK